MDYSQFLLMHHEIGLLIVFILVFLFDTFGCKKVQGSLSVTALVLFGAFTVYGFFAPQQTGEAFAGMYATSPIVASIKNILNIGMFIVLLQRDAVSAPRRIFGIDACHIVRHVPYGVGTPFPYLRHRS